MPFLRFTPARQMSEGAADPAAPPILIASKAPVGANGAVRG